MWDFSVSVVVNIKNRPVMAIVSGSVTMDDGFVIE